MFYIMLTLFFKILGMDEQTNTKQLVIHREHFKTIEGFLQIRRILVEI